MAKVTCPTCKKNLSVGQAGDDYCYYCLTTFTLDKSFKFLEVRKPGFAVKFSRTLSLYFLNSKFYSPARIIFEFTFVPFPIKMILGYVLYIMGVSPYIVMLSVEAALFTPAFMLTVFFVPFVETAIGQTVPIWFLSKITKSRCTQVIVSALFFAVLHVMNTPYHPVIVFPVAIFLSWGYILLKQRSFLAAYFGTYAMHAMHNAAVTILMMMFSSVFFPQPKVDEKQLKNILEQVQRQIEKRK